MTDVAVTAERGCDDLTCSVYRNCSSTGVVCDPEDRACASEAQSKNLEVKCEQTCTTGKRFVYCPPDTGRSDSSFVWVLLVLAVAIAIIGGTMAWVVLRKTRDEGR